MFYLKTKRGNKIYLEDGEDGNIFDTCPVCGKEHHIDLASILRGGDCDMWSTQVYCSECSEKRNAQRSEKPQPRRTAGEIAAYEEGHDEGVRYAQRTMRECLVML